MNFNEIPEYDELRFWKNANNNWEAKLIERKTANLTETVLHLSEDDDAENDRIEDGKFYLDVEHEEPGTLRWIRDRLGIEMPSGMDADYVNFREDGTMMETQHNHLHLDRDVQTGRMVALTPA